MAAQHGRELLLKVHDGSASFEDANFTTVGGFASNNIKIANTAIEITSKDSGGFKESLDGGGQRSFSTDAESTFLSDATFALVHNHILNSTQVLRAGLAQMEINKAEAAHPSVFVAGWRPFIGWTCGVALAWHFVGLDVFNWLRLAFFPDMPAPPVFGGTDTLMTVLLSMLGLGGLRTVEKLKGVSREKWKGE